ncbi:MAG: hypothetical protein ACI8RZ_004113 [Myxococcota bacterium]|jgi:hypothetical protein
MLILLSALAHADPIPLDLTLPTLQPVRSALLTELLVGIGQAVSPYQITGPTQSPGTHGAWQCLGVDNATLDIAGRCPFTEMTRRAARD